MTPLTVAIYIRLSLEDGDLDQNKPESESITNQRDMLMDYIRRSPELCGAEVLEFCDDGYSGKNFDRPGVKKLLETARSGAIQCILVKDLSRFGRDYITVGNYISRVFPFLGVRFIAVNDHFDSDRREDLDSIDTSFKTLIYDLYSRDLSRKVRSAKKTLAARGVYINPVAPYGYRRDPQDRHRLIPDPATAVVVRRIFTMVAGGLSTLDVTRTLNAEHIPTPSQAKLGTPSEHANWHNNTWKLQTVQWIIRDQQYIGSNVFGKRVRDQVGNRRLVKAKMEDWIVVADCHEPLVSKELFQQAQDALGGEFRQTNGYTFHENPLSKKVYCGICGYAISLTRTKRPYYRCLTPRTVPDAACYQEKVYLDQVMEMAKEAICVQTRYAADAKQWHNSQKEQRNAAMETLRQKMRDLQAEEQRITDQSRRLYESFAVDGTLFRDAYLKQKSVLQGQRGSVCQAKAETNHQMESLMIGESQLIKKYLDLEDVEKLTKEQIVDLLHRVTIWPDGRIEISLNYLDEIPFHSPQGRNAMIWKEEMMPCQASVRGGR